LEAARSNKVTFANAFAFCPSMSRGVSLVLAGSRSSECERILSSSFPPSQQSTRGARPRTCTRLYTAPGLVSMIFVVVKFEILTTARESSPLSSELEAEAVTRARGCSEDSAVERGASSEQRVSTTDSVWPISCSFPPSPGPASCSSPDVSRIEGSGPLTSRWRSPAIVVAPCEA
jgi:hypothetical protein